MTPPRSVVLLPVLLPLLLTWQLLVPAHGVSPSQAPPSSTGARAPVAVSVVASGGRGDGVSDDSAAIGRALARACQVAGSGQDAVVLLRRGKTFLARAGIALTGPCGRNRVVLQVDGTLLFDARKQGTFLKGLLYITKMNAVTIRGGGRVDGRGADWWPLSASSRPDLILISMSSNVEIFGITTVNPPKMHVTVQKCNNVRIEDMSTSAPANSPNTDSIHVSNCTNVLLSRCHLSSGDDCISIVGNTRGLLADNLICSAGHGYSIGSLGRGGAQACMSNITIRNSVLKNTTNGLRIKTYQGGQGAVYNVRFQNITLDRVRRPIILDQFYCDIGPCPIQQNAVALFDISFSNIRGSTTDPAAGGGIFVQCSASVPCSRLRFANVRIMSASSTPLSPLVNNVFGTVVGSAVPALNVLTPGPPRRSFWQRMNAQAALCGALPVY